jgi:putative membrane protein insertion efficiency factor
MLNRILVTLLRGLVHFYRLTLSPLWGKNCRFQPTCSAYALEALNKHGAWRGSWLVLKRLGRCHPFKSLGAKSGYDPVP